MEERQKQGIAFDMDRELYDKTVAEAARLGIPFAGFVRQLIVRYFDSLVATEQIKSA